MDQAENGEPVCLIGLRLHVLVRWRRLQSSHDARRTAPHAAATEP